MLVRREFFPPRPSGTVENPTALRNWTRFADAGLRIGNPAAPVTIVEFSDFQCPACRGLAEQLETVRARHPGDVSILYRHYPLTQIHPFARQAALAAECAAEQHRFPEFHDALFRAQDSIGTTSWSTFAERAQVADIAAFARCVRTEAHAARISQDLNAGRELEVEATPTVLINGKRFTGVGAQGSLLSLVDKALRESKRR